MTKLFDSIKGQPYLCGIPVDRLRKMKIAGVKPEVILERFPELSREILKEAWLFIK